MTHVNYRVNMNDEKYVENTDVQQVFETTQSEGGQTRTMATTVNKDDAGVVETSSSSNVVLVRQLTDTSSTGYSQDIKAFLMKPQLVATGNLSTTDTATTYGSVTLPASFLASSAISPKVSGYFGIRGTMVVRLQVNGTRFQQGRYMLVALPLAGASQTSTWIDNYFRLKAATLTQRTQLPGVELDIACDSVVELRLPFVSARSACLVSPTSVFANVWAVRLFPYSPLQAGSGDNVAPYSLWVHMEDVELTGVAIPQSGIRSKKIAKGASDEEQRSAGIQPLSSGLAMISSGMSKLSTIPLLSAFAAPASWVTDVASKAAWSLGYSKPANLAPQHKIVRTVDANFANADAADNSNVLAYTSRNFVSPLPGFAGSDVDEMSLKYIATKYAYFSSFEWNDSQGVGTPLVEYKLCAGTFKSNVSLTPLINAYTPLSFVARFFMYYRGSIKLRFKLVKTEFHSGRLLITFSPRVTEGNTSAPSLATSQYLHRQIVDIRNNNEFEIVFPYVALENYLLTDSALSNYPLVNVFILDPLVAPSTVPSNIKVLVEIAGGDDIEFQVPRQADVVPMQVGEYQMGDDSECGFSTTVFGGKISKDIVSSEMCVGEHITSFRQLLKVPCVSSVTDPANGTFPYAHFSPFAVSVGYVLAGAVSVTYTFPDLYSILGNCYALHRGSVRIKLLQNLGHSFASGTDNALAYYQDAAPDFADWVINVNSDRFGNTDARGCCNTITQPYITTLNNGIEVTVPQYSRTHSRAVGDHIVSADTNINSRVNPTTTLDPFTLVVDRCAGSGAGYYFARCGGDDLEFGMFISTPLLAEDYLGQL